MFPAIIPARLVSEFKFWDGDNVHQGMRYGTNLYRCVASFPLSQQQQAYSLGTNLCEQNQQAALTKSKAGYTVWLSLRSAEMAHDYLSLETLVPVEAI
ncbi:hypothetical protein [Stenomitos frigidus]|nr:hypothetical protein [Stenomitos frigidus]